MIYLQCPNKYIQLENELDPTMFLQGSSYEDYLKGLFIPLTEELIAFRQDNPSYDAKYIIEVQHPEPIVESVPELTLEEKRRIKLNELLSYDNSYSVNSFYLNNNRVWLNKTTRVGLMNSLNIEKTFGKEESTLWFDDLCITVNIDAAILMLGALELYALECYNVTARHKSAISKLLENIEDYDYTIGYPDKLEFTV